MPVAFHEPLSHPGEWGLFRIEESESALYAALRLSDEEERQLSLIRGAARRREFLAARVLLHVMSGRAERGALVKDMAGKPHLADSHFHVSISHTRAYAAAVAHPSPCGIDVQRIVEKIERIAPKFISGAEEVQIKEATRLLQLHIIWSAKEAMYKAFGRREIDFREHLYVDLGNFSLAKTTATGMLRRGELMMLFDLTYRLLPDTVMVACVERLAPV